MSETHSETPMTAEAAQTRLTEMRSDKGFTEKYLAGDVAAGAEMRAVHAAIGTAPDPDQAAREAAVATLKNLADLPDKMWDQVKNGGPVYPHEREEALRAKHRLLGDAKFRRDYLEGGRAERSIITQISLILSSPVVKADAK